MEGCTEQRSKEIKRAQYHSPTKREGLLIFSSDMKALYLLRLFQERNLTFILRTCGITNLTYTNYGLSHLLTTMWNVKIIVLHEKLHLLRLLKKNSCKGLIVISNWYTLRHNQSTKSYNFFFERLVIHWIFT